MSLSTSECSGKHHAPSVPTPGLADDNAKVPSFPRDPRGTAPPFQDKAMVSGEARPSCRSGPSCLSNSPTFHVLSSPFHFPN